MKSNFLDDVYRDFFGIETKKEKSQIFEEKKDIDLNMSNIFSDINNLWITNESKELLKKIIEYMRKYNEKMESNFIPFNISINSDDEELINNICIIINNANQLFGYLDGNLKKISLSKLENEKDNFYSKIILLTNLKSIELEDIKAKENLSLELLNRLEKQNITVLADNEDNLNRFYLVYNKLKDFFSFNIIYQKPDVNDLYETICQKIDASEDDNIKL